MIDQGLRTEIIRNARIAYEQIAYDFMASGEGCADDAVEPVMWRMIADFKHELSVAAYEVISDPSHPNHVDAVYTIKTALKEYF